MTQVPSASMSKVVRVYDPGRKAPKETLYSRLHRSMYSSKTTTGTFRQAATPPSGRFRPAVSPSPASVGRRFLVVVKIETVSVDVMDGELP